MGDDVPAAVRTLFSEAASRAWSGPLAAAGRLTLTTASVSFQPTGAFAAMFREQAFTLPLPQLERAEWRSLRSRLALVHRAGDPIVLEGALITRLAVSLRAMGLPVDEEVPRPAALGQLDRVEPASVVAGILRSPGWLALGARGIYFESRGLVEHIAGVRGRGVSLEDLTLARVDGGAIVVEGGAEPVSVEVGSPAGWLAAIASAAAEVPPPEDRGPPELETGELPLATGTGVLQGLESGQAVRGWYTLLPEAGLVFQGMDDAGPVHVALSDVQRAVYGRLSADDPDLLRITQVGGETLVLRPRGGQATLAVLRSAALALPIADAAEMGDLGMLRTLSGEVTFARITTNQRDSVSFRSGWMVQGPDGIGLVMKDGLDWRHPRGTRVRLTVGVDRGVYEIDGRVLRLGEVEPDQLGAGWPGRAEIQPVLFVAVPHADEVRFTRTRRQDYRVPTSEVVLLRTLRWIPGGGRQPWGQGREGRLTDLSASGCGVLLKHEQQVGRFFEVHVQVRGRLTTFAAEVVHGAKVTDEDLDWWRHGLRFVGLDEQAHARLAREVRRRETRARFLGDPDEDEAEEEAADERQRAGARTV